MRLAVVSAPQAVSHEAQTMTEMLCHGLELLHIRKPSWADNQIEELIDAIPMEFRSKITLHSHYNLAYKLGLGGIHLTEKTKDYGYQEQLINLRVSISTHSTNQALELGSLYSYAFISPVFNSISKANYNSAYTSEELIDLNNRSSIPLFALSGVSTKTLPQAKQLGFKGVAVLGSVWEGSNPYQMVKQFIILKRACHE